MDSKEQDAEIRKFLLGQLAEERAEQFEDRIFADPDFAEEVQIVESELIADYREGTLSPAALSSFEQKYLSNSAELQALEYESILNEFLRAKSASTRTAHAANAAASTKAATARPDVEANTPSVTPEKPKHESLLARLKSLLQARPAWSYSVIAACLLLFIIGGVLIGSWLRQSVSDDSAQAERRLVEEDLARLNLDAANAASIRPEATVDLLPGQRYGGAMPRVVLSDAHRDAVIKLRLNLTHGGVARYRAVFLDQNRRELFAVSDLPTQNTTDGPQIWILVPTKYLKRGDYQINGSGMGKDGVYVEDNAYSFRVTAGR